MQVDRIIFCVFLAGDLDVYKFLLPRYFPLEVKHDQIGDGRERKSDEKEIGKQSEESSPKDEDTEEMEGTDDKESTD